MAAAVGVTDRCAIVGVVPPGTASFVPGANKKRLGLPQVQAETQLGKVYVVGQNVWVQLARLVNLPQRLV
jgi:hypothetical protein